MIFNIMIRKDAAKSAPALVVLCNQGCGKMTIHGLEKPAKLVESMNLILKPIIGGDYTASHVMFDTPDGGW